MENKITRRELGEFIRWHMKAVQWEVADLAKASGLSYNNLLKYAAGQRLPRQLDMVIIGVREAVKKEIRRRRELAKWL